MHKIKNLINSLEELFHHCGIYSDPGESIIQIKIKSKWRIDDFELQVQEREIYTDIAPFMGKDYTIVQAVMNDLDKNMFIILDNKKKCK